MQTKRQLKRCTWNVHPSFADFRPGLGVNFHILLTQNWLWESSLSLLSLWCILFQIKLGLFRENLNLKKHLGPKNGWSSLKPTWVCSISACSWYWLLRKSACTKTFECDMWKQLKEVDCSYFPSCISMHTFTDLKIILIWVCVPYCVYDVVHVEFL